MAFTATDKAPGVYIDEIDVPGPIPGVGTSTVAIIGPARRGPINTPTFLTNWTQFVDAFGVQDDFGPYIAVPQVVFAAHAVRGFFDNGGATCYFVRVSKAARAVAILQDGDGKDALVVTAQREGVAGNAITVKSEVVHMATTTAVRAEGTLTADSLNNRITVVKADSDKFKAGDIVAFTGPAELATIDFVTDTTITFRTNLATPRKSGDKFRIADLKDQGSIQEQTTFRVANTTNIFPGSYVTLTQNGTSESAVVQAVEGTNKFITLASKLTQNFSMATAANDIAVVTQEFKLTITNPNPGPGTGTEVFDQLSLDPRHTNYFARIVKSKNVDIALTDPPSSSLPPKNIPVGNKPLSQGKEEDILHIDPGDYTKAIDTLQKVDDVNLLCIPDSTDQIVQKKMIEHCETMQDRFAILDPQDGATLKGIDIQLRGDPTKGDFGLSSNKGYAALYYPRIIIANPVGPGRLRVPPSGHIAGVYARTDNTRGVHKAPANEAIRGALALEQTLTDGEQGPLNEKGINVLRGFSGRGVTIWGARTIAPHDITQWRYINVRRLMLFIEESIQEGTAFAVFEPNNLALWAKVKRQTSEFLTRVWRDGALFGATADKAFRVRIDEELNPPSLRALGQLVIEVIVFPVTPAEFIVFRVIQKPGGGSFDEI